MADKKDKSKRGSTDAARRIWLAGIGAYGRAFTEAQEALKDMSGGTSRVFDELVQKGEFIEMAVDNKRKELMGKTGLPEFSMPDLHMDERIAKMRSRLMRGEEVAEDISGMDARLTRIEAKLDQLMAMLGAGENPAAAKTAPVKKAPAKKAPAKKATTRTTKTAK